jgi:hypothetical protein
MDIRSPEARKTDHIRIGSAESAYENFRPALDRVPTRLAETFVATHIGLDVRFAQPLKCDSRRYNPCTDFPIRCAAGDNRQDHMIAARQQFEAIAHGRTAFSLWQDAPATCHDRIGRQNDRRNSIPLSSHSDRLGIGNPQAIRLRRFVPVDGFVDGRPENRFGDDPNLGEQRFAPRTFASQDKRHGLT